MMYGSPYFQPPQGGFYPAQPQGGAMPDNLAAYKAPYQMQQPPMMQQPPQPQQMPQAVSALTFVLGEAEASAYPVAPGNTVSLWDKNESTVYIKSMDANGVPSMRILDYTERTAAPRRRPAEEAAPAAPEYARAEDLRALENRHEQLAAKLDRIADMIGGGGGADA